MSKKAVKLSFRVAPNAKKDQIVGVQDNGIIKVKIRAKPIDGSANIHLIKFLSKKLGVRKDKIKLVSGERSRRKFVGFYDIEKKELLERLLRD